MEVRTRFAPSPTGYLHIGNIRTALYSWLFARNCGGKFILRIEDTDYERSKYEGIKSIIDSMNWLRLDWDEGPYFQTKRLNRYQSVINKMLTAGIAYKCYCSKNRLETLRKEQIIKGEKPRYDRYCYNNRYYHACNKPYVVRFSNPQHGYVIFNDQIRGQIKFNNQELDDLIIRRTDGFPTYNFCVVIDDWDMKITHVIRGEDHINNTPRQINILKALNAPIPIYAHVSMINGDDGKKISKRHCSTMTITYYRNKGFLPEALLNYLVRLGWSSGNKEIFSREEMINLFSIKMVSKSPSSFNFSKLLWLNHYYINTLSSEYVSTHLQWHLKQAGIDIRSGPHPSEIIKLLGKRYKTLKEITNNCRYFYEEFYKFDPDIAKEYLCPFTRQILKTVRNKLIKINNWNVKSINQTLLDTTHEMKVQENQVRMPLRIAVTGIKRSPSIDSIIYIIGKIRSISRINKALDFIDKNLKGS